MKSTLRGPLNRDTLRAALKELQAANATGALHVEKEGAAWRIYFERGRIVSADSDTWNEELSKLVAKRANVELSDLDAAFREAERSERPFLQVLRDSRLAPEEELEAASKELGRTLLHSVFSWRSGDLHFEEGEPGVATKLFDLAPSDVILEGMRRSMDQRSVEATLGVPGAVIGWPSRPPVPLQETTLSTKETAVLDVLRSSAEGRVTPAEIVANSPFEPEVTLRTVGALVSSGVLELHDEAAREVPVAPASRMDDAVPSKIGRFEIDGPIGRGSMGEVLLARDPAIDRVVAIKLIQTANHLAPADLEKYRERFYREASAAGQLHHPGIVTVYDIGHTDVGTPFIVMEYVKGRTLREVLDTETLTLDRTLELARDLLDALSYAHERGIVHRDIKPSNILVTPDYRGKIMDFGIAHVVGSELTTGDDVLGSPYYMAPEQLSKKAIGPQTDLFSFAVVLYRMLTGELPFAGDSFAAIAQAILSEHPVSPDRLNPEVSPALGAIVLRSLAKDPAERYESAAELAEALSHPDRADPRSRAAEGETHGDRWLLVAIALVAGAFLVFRLVLMVQEIFEPPTPPEPPAAAADLSPGESSDFDEATPVDPVDEPDAAPAPSVTERPSAEDGPTPPPAVATRAAPTKRLPVEDPTPVVPNEPEAPSEADLFYEARLALERGELEESRHTLEQLLLQNPTFEGAAELLTEVTDALWARSLPLSLRARHRHRFGGCEGELSFAALGVRFESDDHGWAWPLEDIRVLERPTSTALTVETFDKDVLAFGKNKRYRFELAETLEDEDWARYQRLTRKRILESPKSSQE